MRFLGVGVMFALAFAAASASRAGEDRLILSSPSEIQDWQVARAVTRGAKDSVLHPAKIEAALLGCAGEEPAFSRCVERSDKVRALFRAPLATPDASLDVAMCFLTGCDGMVIVSPANACMWLGHFVRSSPRGASAAQAATQACERADFGGFERRAAVREAWKAAAAQAAPY